MFYCWFAKTIIKISQLKISCLLSDQWEIKSQPQSVKDQIWNSSHTLPIKKQWSKRCQTTCATKYKTCSPTFALTIEFFQLTSQTHPTRELLWPQSWLLDRWKIKVRHLQFRVRCSSLKLWMTSPWTTILREFWVKGRLFLIWPWNTDLKIIKKSKGFRCLHYLTHLDSTVTGKTSFKA
jgi:hypothetical protein